jgi:uncharacterized protein YndB with AHSA1/START domain
MSKPKFVYVTYIQSTPEQVFNALTDPEMTRDYWVRHRNASDWKVGSRWEHQDYDTASIVDIAGEVVERTPPTKLVITWAFPGDVGNAAKTSRVTFLVEPSMGAVRLTVTHDELEPDSEMAKGVAAGWPMVLSSLKTLLESGAPMEMTKKRMTRPPAA